MSNIGGSRKSLKEQATFKYLITRNAKAISYGVLKVEDGNVKVYRDQHNYDTIQSYKAVSAVWAGNEVLVTSADGKKRNFRDVHNHSEVR